MCGYEKKLPVIKANNVPNNTPAIPYFLTNNNDILKLATPWYNE